MFELTEEVKDFFVSYGFAAADFDALLSVSSRDCNKTAINPLI